MTGDEPSTPARPDPDRVDRAQAAPVVLAVQLIALLGLIVYAVLGLVREVPLDVRVLAALTAFGLGIKPSTLGDILRRMLGVERER